jgi:RNA polymerase sigma-70 factor (ECF subfamily)
VLRRVRGSAEDAEEITNDIFLAVVDLGETYDGSCSVFTWLCSLARNRIVDFRRRADAAKRVPEDRLLRLDDATKRALRDLHDPSVSVEELVEQMDRVRLVQSLLESLSPEQREAVTMRYVEGFSVQEIARVMKRSEKAVERLLERAKKKPRREILRWLGDEGFRTVCLELLTL